MLIEFNLDPLTAGIIGGLPRLLLFISLITLGIKLFLRKEFKRHLKLIIALVVLIVLGYTSNGLTAVITESYVDFKNTNQSPQIEDAKGLIKPPRFDDAEIQVIDLLHLAETENKEVFSQLVAYAGMDGNRNLKDHLDINSVSEREKVDLYFNELKSIIDYCYQLKPYTGDFDSDFTFVITNSKKLFQSNLQLIRVEMRFCQHNEANCLDEIYNFDFVMFNNDLYLYDINQKGLFKSTSSSSVL